mgnify:CR=1 FL=1
MVREWPGQHWGAIRTGPDHYTYRQEPEGALLPSTLMDVLATDEEAVPDLVDSRWQQSQVRRLPRKEREVLEKRYGLRDGVKHTQRDIARQLGISRSYVSRIEKRALRSMGSLLRSFRPI